MEKVHFQQSQVTVELVGHSHLRDRVAFAVASVVASSAFVAAGY